ncbi:unnamed protein product (macronuclear) [Paramecium tetraurelia]|uniref:Uncharacterized protein n=1 Tax=Paramecium tetraurelia TaxID=5888 RepID=A0EDM9_PARTE|nr:uncharacterized protein GSPATT00025740001 [Paramecium tetraurelia]CAK93396.1 unnamed protein product [Paramecium tetraurelia]|eukprot:XP_001460793.1 hypothetical protein (macronuclear) [Paramecium tetraurelia strain d4-2]
MDVSIEKVKHRTNHESIRLHTLIKKDISQKLKKNHFSPPSSPSILEAVRSKPLIKIERQQRSPVVQQINDLDFGYMEELERKKMFMMIRLGHIKDPARLLPVHNYDKIPILPKKKKRKNNQTPSPNISPLKVSMHNSNDISLPTLSTRLHEDPYQMNRIHNTTKQKLDQKQRRLNVINKRILNKFSIE